MEPERYQLRDGRQVTLRLLKHEDAEALIRYLDAVRRETPFLLWGPADDLPDADRERHWIQGRLDHPAGITISAWDGPTCVAVASIEGEQMFRRRRHAAALGISVLGAFHDVGLGTRIMQRLMDWARQRPEIHVVELAVLAHNARAIAVYQRAGFVESGRKRRAIRYEDGTYGDELLMSAWVGPVGPVDVA